MSSGFKKLLILPRVKIHNANALSSPFTIGFPAMTAWLGATHALQRKLNAKGLDVIFSATGVVSHSIDLQIYRGANDFVSSIIGTGNPLDKTGSRSSFIEEARCHAEVSLIIEVQKIKYAQQDELIDHVSTIMNAQMKMAGGDIRSFDSPEIIVVEEGDDLSLKRLNRKLMPGYALVSRQELLEDAMSEGQDALDALLDYLVIHHSCEQSDDDVQWQSKRKQTYDDIEGTYSSVGWVVPIATGFYGINDIGEAKNQRDPEAPHRFAESIVTLGEFKMPYRFNSVEDMLWRYQYDEANNLYQCCQSQNG